MARRSTTPGVRTSPAPADPPRLLTVWCPDWSVTAACLAGAVPVVGAARGDGAAPPVELPMAVMAANQVVARSAEAGRAGVRVGQRRREAQRCCPELILVPHDPARDAREFEPVVRAVAELAPRLDLVQPGWITLAARGPSRYHGGDRAIAALLTGVVGDLIRGPVGVGVADGRFASIVAARQASGGVGASTGASTGPVPLVVPPGASPEYLAPLPIRWAVEVGDADPPLVDVLGRLGLRTFGDLAALPAADLLARFGRSGAALHRLATGLDERPPVVVEPVPERRIEEVFEPPVEQVAPVVFAAKRLADRLYATLSAEGRVCTRLFVVAETEHGERTERSWYRDGGLSAAAMVERVRWQLDGWFAQPGGLSAGIALVRLAPDEVRSDDGVQVGLWGGRSRADDDAARAVTRLVGIAGDEAVRVPAWRGGRLPAERYAWVPASSVDLDAALSRLAPGAGPWPGALPPPSPAQLFDEPHPAEVLDPAGAVVRVGGRGDISGPPATLVVDGAPRPIEAWAGPWPLDQHWWEPRRHRRLARLQVVTDDGSAYVVIAEQRRWWVSAVYA